MSLADKLREALASQALERRKKKSPAGQGHRNQLTITPMKLVPVERGDKILGGRKSRRARKNKWVPR